MCGNAPKVQILPQTLLTKGGIFRKHNTSVHSAAEFYRQLCVKLGLEASQKKTVMFQRVQEYFYSMSTNKNVHCMVCLDEAQYLNSDILRDLKMLCNFCMDSKNCFSLILLGQPVLTSLMMRQPNEALRRRIAVSYGFAGFSICPKQTLGIVPKRYTNPTFTCF
ncbi:ATP-binding protein [Candidatus Merdisoma sp. JLR.KK011]|uniref:ATP-binding protein n=1 Tax=Candidatus Merdisoma sp. JLR.KK011 TaxID=3114299 RepID=UPI002FF43251